MADQNIEIGRERAIEFFQSIDFFERFQALQNRFPWDGVKEKPFPKAMVMEALRARLPMARITQKKVRYGHSIWLSFNQDDVKTQVMLDFVFGRIEPFFSPHPLEGYLSGPLQYLSRELCGEPAIIPPSPQNIWDTYNILDGIIDIIQNYVDGVRGLLSVSKIDWGEARIVLQRPHRLEMITKTSQVLGTGQSQEALFEADYKVRLGEKIFTVTPAFLENFNSLKTHIHQTDLSDLLGEVAPEKEGLFYRRDDLIAVFHFSETQPGLYAFKLTHAWIEKP